jgi:hypothetical protein
LAWDVAIEAKVPFKYVEPIAWHGGFAALDWRDRDPLKLLVSADGRNWSHRRLPVHEKRPNLTLLAFRRGLVLAHGVVVNGHGGYQIWFSRDGISWARRGAVAPTARTPGYGLGGRLLVVRNRLAYLAFIGPPNGSGGARPGTWAESAAAVGSGSASPRGERGTWAWTSSDGVSWKRERARGLGRAYVGRLTSTERGLAGFLMRGHVWLVESADAVSWHKTAFVPTAISESLGGYTGTEEGFIFAEQQLAPRPRAEWPHLRLWRVTQSRGFSLVADAALSEIWGIASVASTIVVAAAYGDGAADPGRPFVLVSNDGGATFEKSQGWPALEGTHCLVHPVIAGRTVVVAAGCPTPGAALLIVADLPQPAEGLATRRQPSSLSPL